MLKQPSARPGARAVYPENAIVSRVNFTILAEFLDCSRKNATYSRLTYCSWYNQVNLFATVCIAVLDISGYEQECYARVPHQIPQGSNEWLRSLHPELNSSTGRFMNKRAAVK